MAFMLLALAGLLAFSFALFQRTRLIQAGQRALRRQPDSIELVRLGDRAWGDPASAEALARPLREKGFVDLGVYQVLPLAGVKLGVMVNEKESVAAFLCERPKSLGFSLELNVRYADGTTTLLVDHGDNGVPRPPFFRVLFDASGASSGELYERLLRERAPAGIKAIDAGNVIAEYRSAWTRMIRWQKGRGLSAGEVATIAGRSPAAPPPASPPAPSGDVACPHCGQFNEPQRDVCWACYQLMRGGAKAPAVAAASAPPAASSNAWSAEFPGEEKPDDSIRVEPDGSGVRVTWRLGSTAAGLVLFALAAGWVGLNRFLGGLGGRAPEAGVEYVLLAWTLGPAAIYGYLGLVLMLDRGVIRIDPASLTVRYGPLPWSGARDVPTPEIARVYSEEYVSKARGVGVFYRVWATLKSGETVKLVGGLSTPDKAETIVAQLGGYVRG